jgi:peptidoglycan-associated lipoprotein
MSKEDMMKRLYALTLVLGMAAALTGCVKSSKPANTPAPAPSLFPGSATSSRSPAAVSSEVPPAPVVVPMDAAVTPTSSADPLVNSSIVEINKDSPLRPIFFAYDSDALDDTARASMNANAAVMRKYNTWIVTVEGHCDERGTAEYNLELGDRRAQAVKNYMVSLGIPADRLKTVSYGSEFPFVPGHDEKSWQQNRRAHFMLTAKQ